MSMEKVYVPSKLGYTSPVIDLKEFLKSALIAENELYGFFHDKSRSNDEEDTRQSFANFSERNGHFGEASEVVISEVDNALARIIEHFPIIDYEPAYPPLNSKLMSHKIVDDIRKTSDSSKCKMSHISRSRYYKHRDIELERPLQPKRSVADKDLIVTVNLMRPSNYMRSDFGSYNDFRTMCEVKFLVRGNMSLMKLREKIFCQGDFWCNLEDKEDASNTENYFMYQYPSSFMFVYDTFYVDDSSDKCTDITLPIREFMERKKQSFNEYYVKRMSETRIIDLKFRLGFPYIFVHQGHCEHLMIFTDLRLMNVNDAHELSDYPVTAYDVVHSVNCCACKDSTATYVVTESDRMPISPAFMCEPCFKSFHYDRNMRLGNFKAYHYIDRGSLE